MNTAPIVGIVMGSDSDLPTMQAAADTLTLFNIPFELTVVSAHRTPDRMVQYAKTARERGLKVIIAGAGGAAQCGADRRTGGTAAAQWRAGTTPGGRNRWCRQGARGDHRYRRADQPAGAQRSHRGRARRRGRTWLCCGR